MGSCTNLTLKRDPATRLFVVMETFHLLALFWHSLCKVARWWKCLVCNKQSLTSLKIHVTHTTRTCLTGPGLTGVWRLGHTKCHYLLTCWSGVLLRAFLDLTANSWLHNWGFQSQLLNLCSHRGKHPARNESLKDTSMTCHSPSMVAEISASHFSSFE